ncbi:MAG: hypothetical protein KAT48_06525 [Bacteroidales bacterium]|nr:hypothetical protein [Bacteroidales bacterium]
MDPILTTLITTAGTEVVKFLIKYLTTASSNTQNPYKRDVLREIRENIKVLSHRERKIDMDLLIKDLSNNAIMEAYTNGYNFNKLKRGRPKQIPQELTAAEKNNLYFGWDCKRMIDGIDNKISDLHRLRRLHDDVDIVEDINLTARFNNLNYQLVLLVRFLQYRNK